MGGWVILRYAEAAAFLRDHGHFSRAALIEQMLRKFGPQLILESQSHELAFSDPPGHTRFKNLVSRAFTPQSVAALKPHLEEIVDGLLDRIADRGQMDSDRGLRLSAAVDRHLRDARRAAVRRRANDTLG